MTSFLKWILVILCSIISIPIAIILMAIAFPILAILILPLVPILIYAYLVKKLLNN